MANYTKLTDFASKDTLPSGNANKIVKGAEIDDEFVAIENAIQSKSNTDSPTFTGVPIAPTAVAGTNTTQIATTAFVTNGITTSAATKADLNNASQTVTVNTINAVTVDLGNWTVTESSGVLYFATGGTNKMKLDANGTLTVVGDIIAYGTV